MIFKKEFSSLFTEYGFGIDTIQHILHSIGYKYKDLDRKSARKQGILVIEQLLKNGIIEVSYWGKYDDIIKHLNLNIKQTTTYITVIWYEGASYIDFEGMISFKYQDWYLQKMREEEINVNTDWKWFAEKFVPNLPIWIEKHRPKEGFEEK